MNCISCPFPSLSACLRVSNFSRIVILIHLKVTLNGISLLELQNNLTSHMLSNLVLLKQMTWTGILVISDKNAHVAISVKGA